MPLANNQSFRRQNLLIEFASLKYGSPQGIYMSISPQNPELWWGVMFVRKGPYESGIFKFTVLFPSSYPIHPPIITFLSDVFHPLIVPPTPPISSQGGNSSSAPLYYQQGLPPGYFNLKHGFPEWSTESPVPSRTPNKHLHPNDQLTAASSKRLPPDPPLSPATAATKTLRNKRSYRSLKAERPGDLGGDRSGSSAPLLSILHYLKSTFSDEAVLDDISPNLAANITAWKAWKEHQSSLNASETEEEDSEDDSPPRSIARTAWEDKVSSCVEGSKSEGVLFGGLGLGRAGGGMAGEELIRFLEIDNDNYHEIRGWIENSIPDGSPLQTESMGIGVATGAS